MSGRGNAEMFRKKAALIAAVVMAVLCLAGSGFAEADETGGELWGVAADVLAARTGPSTLFDGAGTYNVVGQRIRVYSRAYDSMSRSWWVKCEIPWMDETRVVWTPYKRFDSSTLPLDSIPEEEVAPPVIDEPALADEEEPESEQSGEQKDEQQDTASPAEWSAVYSSFIATYWFMNMGQQYREAPSVTMRDLDEDGIPEILVWNGVDPWLYDGMADPPSGAVYVYTWADGNIRYAGSFFEVKGGGYPEESVMALDGRSGLYIVNWGESAASYSHIIMRDGQVVTEQNEEPEDLFYEVSRYLRWYTLEEISRIGCPLFLEAPFEMGTIGLDFTADETYRLGEPIRVTVNIARGRAPYSVSVYWYELDSAGMVVRDLATDSFTTEDSTFVREYSPVSSAHTIGVEVWASDLFNTPAYYDEGMMLEIRPEGRN